MFSRRIVVTLALCLAPVAPAAAADVGGMPVYVSEQFAEAARNLWRAEIVTTIRNGCVKVKDPMTSAVCTAAVDPLADAVEAAVDQDGDAMQAALGRLLVNGTTAAALGSLFEDIDLSFGVEDADARPLLTCLVEGAIAGGAVRCKLDATAQASANLAIQALGAQFGCSAAPNSKVCSSVAGVQGALGGKRALDPADLTGVLSAAFRTNTWPIFDPWAGVWLDAVTRVLDTGLDAGLFHPTRKLVAEVTSLQKGTLLSGVGNALVFVATPHVLYDTSGDAAVTQAFAGCTEGATAWSEWMSARDTLRPGMRDVFLTGAEIDLGALRALASVRCPDALATTTVARAKSLEGPLRVRQEMEQLAVPALVAAAALDYVRTSDDEALARDVGAVARFVVRRFAWRARVAQIPDVAGQELPAFSAADQTCEVRLLDAWSTSTAPDLSRGCWSLALGAQVADAAELTQKLGADALQVGALESVFTTLTGETPDLETRTLARAIRRWIGYSAAAQSDGVRAAVLRLGADVLREVGGSVAEAVAPAEGCDAQAAVITPFRSSVVRCTASLLVTESWGSVVTYLGDGAFDDESSQRFARGMVRAVSSAEWLDRTVLIANVGLGGHYVRGLGGETTSHWPTTGSGTFTVTEKLGIALVKSAGPKATFEAGLFTGGFLDALARTVAGEEHQYWLLGATAGWTRIGGRGLGIEAHVALVNPYTFDFESADPYALAGGLSVVAPFDTLFPAESR